jgi:hypothetical protein
VSGTQDEPEHDIGTDDDGQADPEQETGVDTVGGSVGVIHRVVVFAYGGI